MGKKRRGVLRGSGIGPVWRGGRGEEKEEGIPLSVLDTSSQQCRNLLVVFLLVCLYVVAFCAGVTDEMLLRNEGQATIPFTGITFPLVEFFFAAPLIVWILHFNLLYNLYRHRRKLNAYADKEDKLYPFFFNFLGRDKFAAPLLFIALYILPLLVLIYVQVVFLPYRHHWMTYLHQGVVVGDMVLLVVFWTYGSYPILPQQLDRPLRRRLNKAVHVLLLISTIWMSLVIARPYQSGKEFLSIGSINSKGEITNWTDHLHRNLNLSDKTLIQEPNSSVIAAFIDRESGATHPGAINYIAGLDLRNRNLRHAILMSADLRKADFEFADLSEANLWGAGLSRAKFFGAHMNNTILERAHLAGAQLNTAHLEGAVLRFSDLRGADLRWASLQKAHLWGADLLGANLSKAKLRWTDLQATYLQGVNLMAADLGGANLGSAHLQGAILQKAELRGVDLRYVSLQGADLQDTVIEGSCLYKTSLRGTTQAGLKLSTSIVLLVDYEQDGQWREVPNSEEAIKVKQRIAAGTPIQERLIIETNSDPEGYREWRKRAACKNASTARALLIQDGNISTTIRPCYVGLAEYLVSTPECAQTVAELKATEKGRYLLENVKR